MRKFRLIFFGILVVVIASMATMDVVVAQEPFPDTIPPARSAASPSGILPAGTTAMQIALDTDEDAICKYGVNGGQSYSVLPNTFATTGGTSHATTVSGLRDGQSYVYFVRCQDIAGNFNTSDFLIWFGVGMKKVLIPLEGPGFVGRHVLSDGRILLGVPYYQARTCEKIPEAFSCFEGRIIPPSGRHNFSADIEVFIPLRTETTQVVFVPYDGPPSWGDVE